MTPEQREELKQAAQAATAGQWTSYETRVYLPPMAGGFDLRGSPNAEANVKHVALANPSAILSLIAQVEALTVPQVAVSVERGGVYITKGVQSFRLAYEGETRGEQEWYAGVLRKALAVPTIPAIPGTKEGA